MNAMLNEAPALAAIGSGPFKSASVQKILYVEDETVFRRLSATVLLKSSEATRLPIAWSSPRAWRLQLHLSRARPVSESPNKTLPPVYTQSAAAAAANESVEDHCSEERSLQTVAVTTGGFTFHLANLGEAAPGGDSGDYLVCARIEKAKNLLLNPYYHIMEIASEMGFGSFAEFYLAFNRLVGESPLAYRARLPVRVTRGLTPRMGDTEATPGATERRRRRGNRESVHDKTVTGRPVAGGLRASPSDREVMQRQS